MKDPSLSGISLKSGSSSPLLRSREDLVAAQTSPGLFSLSLAIPQGTARTNANAQVVVPTSSIAGSSLLTQAPPTSTVAAATGASAVDASAIAMNAVVLNPSDQPALSRLRQIDQQAIPPFSAPSSDGSSARTVSVTPTSLELSIPGQIPFQVFNNPADPSATLQMAQAALAAALQPPPNQIAAQQAEVLAAEAQAEMSRLAESSSSIPSGSLPETGAVALAAQGKSAGTLLSARADDASPLDIRA